MKYLKKNDLFDTTQPVRTKCDYIKSGKILDARPSVNKAGSLPLSYVFGEEYHSTAFWLSRIST